ncbi:MAG: DeoR/GlpR family DNA-binding transcription regulator [Oscillospiraceae bacterium]|jgi:DeoR/GlpR family transcriptional regulator of sugar metabolism|nr:DeoR/GlpR family DNA-binding transcription regulator [Oscillospiraceae bacterium]
MLINERHNQIIYELQIHPHITVKELAKKLNFSEPTIRRDLTELESRGIITKHYGGAILNEGVANREIPFIIRENEQSQTKAEMGLLATKYISDGMVIMLDGSTSAYHLVPYLSRFKDIIVVTSGAKTALALAEMHIPVFSTGGRMRTNSFSYIGREAEDAICRYNADVMFFSCRGLSETGMISDPSIEEASLRRVMFERCKKKYLLCDGSKFNKTYFYNMGHVSEMDGVISDQPLPPGVAAQLRR